MVNQRFSYVIQTLRWCLSGVLLKYRHHSICVQTRSTCMYMYWMPRLSRPGWFIRISEIISRLQYSRPDTHVPDAAAVACANRGTVDASCPHSAVVLLVCWTSPRHFKPVSARVALELGLYILHWLYLAEDVFCYYWFDYKSLLVWWAEWCETVNIVNLGSNWSLGCVVFGRISICSCIWRWKNCFNVIWHCSRIIFTRM